MAVKEIRLPQELISMLRKDNSGRIQWYNKANKSGPVATFGEYEILLDFPITLNEHAAGNEE